MCVILHHIKSFIWLTYYQWCKIKVITTYFPNAKVCFSCCSSICGLRPWQYMDSLVTNKLPSGFGIHWWWSLPESITSSNFQNGNFCILSSFYIYWLWAFFCKEELSFNWNALEAESCSNLFLYQFSKELAVIKKKKMCYDKL